MKRIEMIDNIVDVLCKLPEYKAQMYADIAHDANRILNAIEMAGMLPPKYLIREHPTPQGAVEVFGTTWEVE